MACCCLLLWFSFSRIACLTNCSLCSLSLSLAWSNSRSISRLERAEEEEEEGADSSKGSALEVQKKRSSSDRKDVGREAEDSWESDSPRDDRRGHEGKAQVASWDRRLEGVMSMGMDMAPLVMELYEP